LVDKNGIPVHYDLNAINSTDNATQHGEVRAITSYIEKHKCFDLSGFTIYTSLEPCVMCAGMITMTSVYRVVFGQHDVQYSKAFERLAIDTRPIGGFPPYPRRVIAQASTLSYVAEIDQAYQDFLEQDDEKVLAKFLASERAKGIYKRTYEDFLKYEVRHQENSNIYQAALTLLNQQKHEKE
jgi:tRNA(Arg) A34 adenosine deaminase TadA